MIAPARQPHFAGLRVEGLRGELSMSLLVKYLRKLCE